MKKNKAGEHTQGEGSHSAIEAREKRAEKLGDITITTWSDRVRIHEVGEKGYIPLCDVLPRQGSIPSHEDRSRADLYAAAPDMLKALKLTLTAIKTQGKMPVSPSEFHKIVKAAINKAKGL